MPTKKDRETDDANGAPLIARKRKNSETMPRSLALRSLLLPDAVAPTIASAENVERRTPPMPGESHGRPRRHQRNQSQSPQKALDEEGSSADKDGATLLTGNARLRLLSRKELLSQATLRGIQHYHTGKHTRRSMSQLHAEIARRDKREPHLEPSLGHHRQGSDVKNKKPPCSGSGRKPSRPRKCARTEWPAGTPKTTGNPLPIELDEQGKKRDSATVSYSPSKSPPIVLRKDRTPPDDNAGRRSERKRVVPGLGRASARSEKGAPLFEPALLRQLNQKDLRQQATLRGISKKKSGGYKTMSQLCKEIVRRDTRRGSRNDSSAIKRRRAGEVGKPGATNPANSADASSRETDSTENQGQTQEPRKAQRTDTVVAPRGADAGAQTPELPEKTSPRKRGRRKKSEASSRNIDMSTAQVRVETTWDAAKDPRRVAQSPPSHTGGHQEDTAGLREPSSPPATERPLRRTPLSQDTARGSIPSPLCEAMDASRLIQQANVLERLSLYHLRNQATLREIATTLPKGRNRKTRAMLLEDIARHDTSESGPPDRRPERPATRFILDAETLEDLPQNELLEQARLRGIREQLPRSDSVKTKTRLRRDIAAFDKVYKNCNWAEKEAHAAVDRMTREEVLAAVAHERSITGADNATLLRARELLHRQIGARRRIPSRRDVAPSPATTDSTTALLQESVRGAGNPIRASGGGKRFTRASLRLMLPTMTRATHEPAGRCEDSSDVAPVLDPEVLGNMTTEKLKAQAALRGLAHRKSGGLGAKSAAQLRQEILSVDKPYGSLDSTPPQGREELDTPPAPGTPNAAVRTVAKAKGIRTKNPKGGNRIRTAELRKALKQLGNVENRVPVAPCERSGGEIPPCIFDTAVLTTLTRDKLSLQAKARGLQTKFSGGAGFKPVSEIRRAIAQYDARYAETEENKRRVHARIDREPSHELLKVAYFHGYSPPSNGESLDSFRDFLHKKVGKEACAEKTSVAIDWDTFANIQSSPAPPRGRTALENDARKRRIPIRNVARNRGRRPADEVRREVRKHIPIFDSPSLTMMSEEDLNHQMVLRGLPPQSGPALAAIFAYDAQYANCTQEERKEHALIDSKNRDEIRAALGEYGISTRENRKTIATSKEVLHEYVQEKFQRCDLEECIEFGPTELASMSTRALHRQAARRGIFPHEEDLLKDIATYDKQYDQCNVHERIGHAEIDRKDLRAAREALKKIHECSKEHANNLRNARSRLHEHLREEFRLADEREWKDYESTDSEMPVLAEDPPKSTLRTFSDKPYLLPPHNCQLCESGFDTEINLGAHIDNVHGGLMDYRSQIFWLVENRGPRPCKGQQGRVIIEEFAERLQTGSTKWPTAEEQEADLQKYPDIDYLNGDM